MRKLMFFVVPLFLVAYIVLAPVNAQDDTETRLSALETRVGAIETQLAGPDGVPTQAASTGAVTVSGVGVATSVDFTLQAGRYQVTATWSGGEYFIGNIWEPSGGNDLLFNEYQTGQSASVIYVAPEAGTYFMEVSNTHGPWEITFTPR